VSETEHAVHLAVAGQSLFEIMLTCFFDVKVVVLVTHDWGFVGRPVSLMIVDDYLDFAGKYYYPGS